MRRTLSLLVLALMAVSQVVLLPGYSRLRLAASEVHDEFDREQAEVLPADDIPAIELVDVTQMLLDAHNRLRKTEKLSSVSLSKRLQEAAEIQAKDMATRAKMTHEGSDGSTVSDRVKRQKYEYRRVGENVAFGRFTIERLMDGWMKSEVHRRNILGGFSQIGAACAIDKNGTAYWCVTFGLPRSR